MLLCYICCVPKRDEPLQGDEGGWGLGWEGRWVVIWRSNREGLGWETGEGGKSLCWGA